jgi:hypothetical protein
MDFISGVDMAANSLVCFAFRVYAGFLYGWSGGLVFICKIMEIMDPGRGVIRKIGGVNS